HGAPGELADAQRRRVRVGGQQVLQGAASLHVGAAAGDEGGGDEDEQDEVLEEEEVGDAGGEAGGGVGGGQGVGAGVEDGVVVDVVGGEEPEHEPGGVEPAQPAAA